MVGESFHPRGCWGEDSDHIRLGATAQKLSRLFAFWNTKQSCIAGRDIAGGSAIRGRCDHKKLDFCARVGYLLPANKHFVARRTSQNQFSALLS